MLEEEDAKLNLGSADPSDMILEIDRRALNNRRLETNPLYVKLKARLLDFHAVQRAKNKEGDKYFN